MNYDKYDKKYFKSGLYTLAFLITSMTLLVLFWDKEPKEGLSCLGVQSNINRVIDIYKKYENTGISAKKENKLLKKLNVSLKNNKKLNCGFNEKAILRIFR